MGTTSNALWPAIVSALLSLLVGGGGVAWYTARESRAARVSGQEHTARRDEVEDREWLVEHYAARVAELEAKVGADAAYILLLLQHAADLRDRIYRRADPPPPPTPTR